jgi:hypothetical protein
MFTNPETECDCVRGGAGTATWQCLTCPTTEPVAPNNTCTAINGGITIGGLTCDVPGNDGGVVDCTCELALAGRTVTDTWNCAAPPTTCPPTAPSTTTPTMCTGEVSCTYGAITCECRASTGGRYFFCN